VDTSVQREQQRIEQTGEETAVTAKHWQAQHYN